MKAAIIQLAVQEGEAEQNRQQAAKMLQDAAGRGARLAVLPELWNCGYTLNSLAQKAETMRGESINLLRKLARQLNMCIIGGSMAEQRDGKFFNTCAAINETGEIVAKYRKAHLYPHGLHEADYFAAGDEWVFAQCCGVNIGLTICYDIFFPEFSRNLCLRGAQILSSPVWVNESIDEFSLMAQSRAVENRCFFILANAAYNCNLPQEHMATGNSLIISPRGEILARAGSGEEVLLADLDFSDFHYLQEYRNPLNDRRNILDEIDNNQL